MTSSLELVLALLASAVAVVVVFRTFNLPPLLGYLIAGVVIGPHALGWVPDSEGERQLAEFGIVFLMFSIGLEFSLPKLYKMRKTVLGLGLLQVLLTIAATVLACVAIGLDWKIGIALGGALAMSSTAIVMRMMAERMQFESAHGREVVGVLLFQDLAVVPLLIVVPALAGGNDALAGQLGAALVKAALVLSLLLFLGPRMLRWWFKIVAKRRSHELFVLNVLLITLGLAWLTELAGLSLALGAFLGGMLIAETEYRHQVEEDIKPFRDVLLGLFFVTVGMQLDLAMVADNLVVVLAIFMSALLFKIMLVAGLSRLLGSTTGTALRTAFALAQSGEFGLVLVTLASRSEVLDAHQAQVVIAAMLLSMLAAPFLIHYSDRLVMRLASSEWMLRSLELHRIAVQSIATDRHVVICGYGRTGQRLGHLLEEEGIGYIALDPDPERVQAAAAAGEKVVFGDAARRESLIAAGVGRASALVITFADTRAALRIIAHAHAINHGVPVIVRTLDDGDMDSLIAAGATEVVPETFESSLMLASHALILVGVPFKRVVRRIRDVRENRYSLMRGFFHGGTDVADDPEETHGPRLHSLAVTEGSFAAGKTLGEIELEVTGSRISSIRRQNQRLTAPPLDTLIEKGDVLVLMGTPEQLAAAELRLLKGRSQRR
jgi:CPA2 family monovalent cation:H+ antiporter-2